MPICDQKSTSTSKLLALSFEHSKLEKTEKHQENEVNDEEFN
jgi:hypothetical protein